MGSSEKVSSEPPLAAMIRARVAGVKPNSEQNDRMIFQVLLGDADLRNLLHIAGGRLEDGAVLGNERLGFLPSGVCLTIPLEGRQVGHGESTPMASKGGSQPLPFLFRLRQQPYRALDISLGRDRLIFVERSLARITLKDFERRGLGLSASGRHAGHLPSQSHVFLSRKNSFIR